MNLVSYASIFLTSAALVYPQARALVTVGAGIIGVIAGRQLKESVVDPLCGCNSKSGYRARPARLVTSALLAIPTSIYALRLLGILSVVPTGVKAIGTVGLLALAATALSLRYLKERSQKPEQNQLPKTTMETEKSDDEKVVDILVEDWQRDAQKVDLKKLGGIPVFEKQPSGLTKQFPYYHFVDEVVNRLTLYDNAEKLTMKTRIAKDAEQVSVLSKWEKEGIIWIDKEKVQADDKLPLFSLYNKLTIIYHDLITSQSNTFAANLMRYILPFEHAGKENTNIINQLTDSLPLFVDKKPEIKLISVKIETRTESNTIVVRRSYDIFVRPDPETERTIKTATFEIVNKMFLPDLVEITPENARDFKVTTWISDPATMNPTS
jgi:hypothetical protein